MGVRLSGERGPESAAAGSRAITDWSSGADCRWTEQDLRLPTHLLGATGYGLIAALGATGGLRLVFWCLLLLSAGALVVAALHDLGWGMVAGLIGAVPVVGWLVALYVALTRWELLEEHGHAVTVALGLSTAPYLIAGAFHGSPRLAFVVAAVLWHAVGVHSYRLGCDATAYSRTVALGPGLVLLLILPLLDLDLPEVDVGLDPHGDAHPA